MKGAFRCVIFALLCEYGHAQCCVGSTYSSVPTDAVQCNNAGQNWVAACESGLSCLVLTCSGKMYPSMTITKLVSSCTTAQLQTASIAAEETAMSQSASYTEVQCVAAAVTTPYDTCSNNCCSNSSTSSGGNVLTSCSCNRGYNPSDGGQCSPCPYGTYKDSIGQYSIVILCCLSLYLSYVTNGDL
jgi:hypothetical protein